MHVHAVLICVIILFGI